MVAGHVRSWPALDTGWPNESVFGAVAVSTFAAHGSGVGGIRRPLSAAPSPQCGSSGRDELHDLFANRPERLPHADAADQYTCSVARCCVATGSGGKRTV
jgi:hypothetical protein